MVCLGPGYIAHQSTKITHLFSSHDHLILSNTFTTGIHLPRYEQAIYQFDFHLNIIRRRHNTLARSTISSHLIYDLLASRSSYPRLYPLFYHSIQTISPSSLQSIPIISTKKCPPNPPSSQTLNSPIPPLPNIISPISSISIIPLPP